MGLYVYQVSGIARKRNKYKKNKGLTDSQNKDMRVINSELITAWSMRDRAIAKLRLINAIEAAD